MPPQLTMTYDFGTTSLKAALVGPHGDIVSHASVSYPISQPRTGWAEQDPRLLWEAGANAGRRALERAGVDPGAVEGVVFVAPWKGIIPVREDGVVLRDALIWMDARAVDEARLLNERMGAFVGTGQEYWPRLMWLKRHEPEVWKASRWIMGVNTYLKWMATGIVVTEPSDDFIRSKRRTLDDRFLGILRAAGLADDLGKFPPSAPSGALVGGLTEAAGRHLGLAPGTPVYGGFGDLPAITYGAGPLVPGARHIYFGTSSWFVCVVDAQTALESPLRFTIDDRLDGALYCLQTGCLAFDWIVEQVYSREKADLGEAFFAFIDTQVAEIAPGSDRLLATHWLNGELPPFSKTAKGAFINLTTTHDRRHMVRAMMESICYTHRMSVDWFEEQTGERVGEITAVGGGASSAVWMQMLADVLGRTVIVPEAPRFVGAVGASKCAHPTEWTGGQEEGRATGRRFEPDPAAARTYGRMVEAYRKIHPALAGLFESLNGPDTNEGESAA